LIINYEIQREEGEKQVEKLRKECKMLKKLLRQANIPQIFQNNSSLEIEKLK